MKKNDRSSLYNRTVYRQKHSKNNQENSDYHLDKKELITKAKEYGRENLKILYGFIKVIGLTTATIILLNLILEARPFNYSNIRHFNIDSIPVWWSSRKNYFFAIRMIMWYASCMVLILTYDAGMFGSMFLSSFLDKFMVLLIFSYIGFEFFSFTILFPNFFVEKIVDDDQKSLKIFLDNFDFGTWWLFIYGFYTICVGVLAFNTIRIIDTIEVENVRPLIPRKIKLKALLNKIVPVR